MKKIKLIEDDYPLVRQRTKRKKTDYDLYVEEILREDDIKDSKARAKLMELEKRFTGYLDDIGHRVYEGDIIKAQMKFTFAGEPAYVTPLYHNGEWIFVSIHTGTKCDRSRLTTFLKIGNIFDKKWEDIIQWRKLEFN